MKLERCYPVKEIIMLTKYEPKKIMSLLNMDHIVTENLTIIYIVHIYTVLCSVLI